MRKRYGILFAVLAIFAIFFAGYGFAVLTTNKEIRSGANLISDVNLSIYDSEVSTVEVTFVDWATILPSQIKTKSVWIQDDSDISMMISVNTKDWLPSNVTESLTFSYAEGAGWAGGAYPKLNPHQRAEVIFTLSAGENCTSGNFSFVIVISGVSA